MERLLWFPKSQAATISPAALAAVTITPHASRQLDQMCIIDNDDCPDGSATLLIT